MLRFPVAALAFCAALGSYADRAWSQDVAIDLTAVNAGNAVWGALPTSVSPFAAADDLSSPIRMIGDTVPDCAGAALRLSRNAVHQASLGPAALSGIELSVRLLSVALTSVGLGTTSNIGQVVAIYLTTDSQEDFYQEFSEWLVGALAAAPVDDEAISIGVDQLSQIAWESLTESVDALLHTSTTHPQCGEIRVSYWLVAPSQSEEGEGAQLVFRSYGDCQSAWPDTGSTRLGLFRVRAQFTLEEPRMAERLSLHAVDPLVDVTAQCNPQPEPEIPLALRFHNVLGQAVATIFPVIDSQIDESDGMIVYSDVDVTYGDLIDLTSIIDLLRWEYGNATAYEEVLTGESDVNHFVIAFEMFARTIGGSPAYGFDVMSPLVDVSESCGQVSSQTPCADAQNIADGYGFVIGYACNGYECDPDPSIVPEDFRAEYVRLFAE